MCSTVLAMTENAPKTGRFAGLPSLAINIVLPFIVYHFAAPQVGERGGLVLSSVPVILWNLLEIVCFRRLDAVGLLVLLGIFLSLGAMTVGGSARFLLLRESLVTGVIGLVFLGSLLLPRPLIYYLARSGEAKRSAEDLSAFETAWPKPRFVRAMYLMTWVWGLGLVFEAVLRCWLIWRWPVERSLALAPVISYAIYFSLLGWTLWYRSQLKGADRKRKS
jgi:intracellular septation protein A